MLGSRAIYTATTYTWSLTRNDTRQSHALDFLSTSLNNWSFAHKLEQKTDASDFGS